ncbi:hypothetical protein BHV42_04595 [Candidatus Melainabacteria bacterium MEL.A1]|nr:hypothetical protein BHV42_04595 [Candidatus Melainabacteria bacterium MEL.A1]
MSNDFRILKTTKTKLGNEIQLIGNNSSNTNKISLVIGVFHGDEPQGKFLIEEYLKKCGMLPTSKSPIVRKGLLFIPCLNPDGMQLGQRTNANGVDLNRNFPTKNWGKNQGDNATCNDSNSAYYGGTSSGSEIETQFLIDTINEFKPDKILTLHAPYKVVNYDGPAQEWAEQISKIINYPVEASIGYPTPGSFGTYAGVEKQIQTITLELDEEIPVEQLVQPAFEIFDKLL